MIRKIGFVFLITLSLQLININHRTRLDESIWVPTGIKFTESLSRADINSSLVSTRPGIPVLIISGTTTTLSRFLHGEHNLFSKKISVSDYAINRIIFAIAISLLSVIAYQVLAKLLGDKKAFLVSLLFTTTTLVVNSLLAAWTDIFLAYFLLISVSIYLIYLKSESKSQLLLAGVFFGLATATKSAAYFLPPTLFVITLLTKITTENLKKTFRDVLWFSAIGLVTMFAIFPYLWLHPLALFGRYQELSDGLSSSVSGSSFGSFPILFYPQKLATDNLFLVFFSLLMLPLVVIEIFKRRTLPKEILFSAFIFFAYSLPVVVISQVKYLVGNPGENIAAFRYLLPALFFLFLFLVSACFYFSKRYWRSFVIFPFVVLIYYMYNVVFIIKNSY